jgi:hypothetical protein
MSVSGLCAVCGSAETVDRCDRCGAVVCGEHLDEEFGVCAECAAELPTGGSTGDPTGHSDVDQYRF